MNTEKRKHIEVVAAIICDGNRIFATQRGYGEWKDWWEFPGGKMESNETPEVALHHSLFLSLILICKIISILYYLFMTILSILS